MCRYFLTLAIFLGIATGAWASGGGGTPSPAAPVPAKPSVTAAEAQIKHLKESLHKGNEKTETRAPKIDLKAQLKANLKASLDQQSGNTQTSTQSPAKIQTPPPHFTPITGRSAVRKLGPPSLVNNDHENSMAAHSLGIKPDSNRHSTPVSKAKNSPFPKPESDFWGIMRGLLGDNNSFVTNHDSGHFQPFLEHQTPQMTVIACSDSRVHTHALSTHPDNELFVIRNIGNQIKTAAGSVDYGVKHLNTPVLLILGHSGCGAIKAAMADTRKLHHAVRHEIEQIKLGKEKDWDVSVRKNIEDQVRAALSRYKKEVAAGRLTVVGAVYDLHDRQGNGNGRVQITSVNGHRDSALIDRVRALAKLAGSRSTQKPSNTPTFHSTAAPPPVIHYAYP